MRFWNKLRAMLRINNQVYHRLVADLAAGPPAAAEASPEAVAQLAEPVVYRIEPARAIAFLTGPGRWGVSLWLN